MHHHSNSGRKLSRQRDQRRALLKGMANSMVLEEKIVTTKPKAKEVAPYVERLISKAKVGTLHSRRQLLRLVTTDQAVRKLVDDLAPRFASRNGGYTRIKSAGYRQGDDAELAQVSFTEEAKQAKEAENKTSERVKPVAKKVAKKPVAKKGKADAKS